MQLRFLTVLYVLIATLLVSASSVNASLVVNVTESGGPTIPILDNGPLDTNPAIGIVSADTTSLNVLMFGFEFVSLGALSNASSAAGLDPAVLTQSGQVLRNTSGGALSVSITVSDDFFVAPNGNPKTMTNSASDTFAFTSAGNSRTFQGGFDPTNTQNSLAIASPLLAFIPPSGIGPFSTSNPGVATLLGSQPIPFALTNVTIIAMNAATSASQRPSDLFTGATIVTSPIPEPSTLVLAGLGSVMLLLIRRKRA